MPPTRELQLINCDATTNWTAVADRDNTTLAIDSVTFQEGTGSLKLGVDASASTTNNWAEYQFDPSSTVDVGAFDYLQLKLYIADSTTLGDITHFFIDFVTDSAYNNYHNWRILPADLAVGWNTVKLYFNDTTASFGEPDLGTWDLLTVHIHHNGTDMAAGTIFVDDFRVIQSIETQYDIKIDSQGYELVPDADQGYSQTDLPFAIDRFGTGELEYSDFNKFQFQAQTDWSTGFNNRFSTGKEDSGYWDGDYVDTTEFGRVKMAPKFAHITAAANTGVVTNIKSYKGSAFFGVSDSPDSYVYSWIGSGSTLTQQAQLTGLAEIIDMEVYNNILYTSAGNGVYQYTGAAWSALAQSAHYMQTLGDTLYASLGQTMQSFDGTTWATEYAHTGWYINQMKTWREKIYYLATDSASRSTGSRSKTSLWSYDGIDRLQLADFDEAARTHMEYHNNKLWFVIGGILKSFNGESVVDELDVIDRYNKQAIGVNANAGNEVGDGLMAADKKLFSLLNDTSATTKVIANGGFGFSPMIGAHSALISAMGTLNQINDQDDSLLVGDINGNAFFLDESQYSTTNVTQLESGWIDMGFPNVDKLFRSMAFYCDSLPSRTRIQLQYQLDDTGTWVNITATGVTGSTDGELQFGDTIKGKRIKYRIQLTSETGTATPVINDIVIKYLISPDVKKRWVVGVALSDNIERMDRTSELKTAKQLLSQLWASRKKKAVVEFQDIDGSKYDVLMNDMQIRGPVRNEVRVGQTLGGEYVAQIELIQA